MREDFLQFIWAQRLYRSAFMTSTDGDTVEVIEPGRLNPDAGPDFFNAKIHVHNVTWVGNVEVHLTSDDWYAHGHDSDPAYDNVVLHVVGRSTGRKVLNSKGRPIPEVSLEYDPLLWQRFEGMVLHTDAIRCEDILHDLPTVIRRDWLDALLVERMNEKCERVRVLMREFSADWDQVFFSLLARAMGGKVNADAMELLARVTPLRILLKHNNPLQGEALLLGQAGMLHTDVSDDYLLLLRREYSFLQQKFNLEPLNAAIWKYARLRPQGFPDVRIAQLAAILRAWPGNFGDCMGLNLNSLLSAEASEYWDSHFRLGTPSDMLHPKALGPDTRRIVVVNCVVPFAMVMAERKADDSARTLALDVLRSLPKEENTIIAGWRRRGIEADDEADIQALIYLRKRYCDNGDCLRCRFGRWVISRGFSPIPYAKLN